MMGTFNGVMTGVLLALFIAVWVWAWSSKNKEKFDKMAQLPLEENEDSREVIQPEIIQSEVIHVK